MSSNIGPEARAAYQKYLEAEGIDERIKRLEDFISKIPKHKATEKIVALNKSRLSKLRREKEAQLQKQKSQGKVVSPFSIKKEGIQIILISDYHVPGVGKTSLLNYLTSAAKDKIGRFTAVPELGIYKYKKIRFQIVDMPSIMKDASKGVANGKEILSQIRACDLICFCVDLTRDYHGQMDLLMEELERADIRINEEPPPVKIEKTGANKIQVFYLTQDAKEHDNLEEFTERVKEIVDANGIRNAIIKIYGKITMDDLLDALAASIVYKKGIIIATKGDLAHTEEQFKKVKRDYSDSFSVIIGSSVKKMIFPDDFGDVILKLLNLMKVFTMNNGIVAEKPLILEKGSTVRDVALKIHRTFLELFDHAIIVRKSARQKRKKVGLDYELKNKDIIEIHTI